MDDKRYYLKFDRSDHESLITEELSDSQYTVKPHYIASDDLPPISYVEGSVTKKLSSYTLLITEAMMNGDLLNLILLSKPKFSKNGRLIRAPKPLSPYLKYFLG